MFTQAVYRFQHNLPVDASSLPPMVTAFRAAFQSRAGESEGGDAGGVVVSDVSASTASSELLMQPQHWNHYNAAPSRTGDDSNHATASLGPSSSGAFYSSSGPAASSVGVTSPYRHLGESHHPPQPHPARTILHRRVLAGDTRFPSSSSPPSFLVVTASTNEGIQSAIAASSAANGAAKRAARSAFMSSKAVADVVLHLSSTAGAFGGRNLATTPPSASSLAHSHPVYSASSFSSASASDRGLFANSSSVSTHDFFMKGPAASQSLSLSTAQQLRQQQQQQQQQQQSDQARILVKERDDKPTSKTLLHRRQTPSSSNALTSSPSGSIPSFISSSSSSSSITATTAALSSSSSSLLNSSLLAAAAAATPTGKGVLSGYHYLSNPGHSVLPAFDYSSGSHNRASEGLHDFGRAATLSFTNASSDGVGLGRGPAADADQRLSKAQTRKGNASGRQGGGGWGNVSLLSFTTNPASSTSSSSSSSLETGSSSSANSERRREWEHPPVGDLLEQQRQWRTPAFDLNARISREPPSPRVQMLGEEDSGSASSLQRQAGQHGESRGGATPFRPNENNNAETGKKQDSSMKNGSSRGNGNNGTIHDGDGLVIITAGSKETGIESHAAPSPDIANLSSSVTSGRGYEIYRDRLAYHSNMQEIAARTAIYDDGQDNSVAASLRVSLLPPSSHSRQDGSGPRLVHSSTWRPNMNSSTPLNPYPSSSSSSSSSFTATAANSASSSSAPFSAIDYGGWKRPDSRFSSSQMDSERSDIRAGGRDAISEMPPPQSSSIMRAPFHQDSETSGGSSNSSRSASAESPPPSSTRSLMFSRSNNPSQSSRAFTSGSSAVVATHPSSPLPHSGAAGRAALAIDAPMSTMSAKPASLPRPTGDSSKKAAPLTIFSPSRLKPPTPFRATLVAKKEAASSGARGGGGSARSPSPTRKPTSPFHYNPNQLLKSTLASVAAASASIASIDDSEFRSKTLTLPPTRQRAVNEFLELLKSNIVSDNDVEEGLRELDQLDNERERGGEVGASTRILFTRSDGNSGK